MAVISLTLTESTAQIISGIPNTITLSASLPSTIFYTLDGSIPTTSSSVYLSPIKMPTNMAGVTLKIYATNGQDSSAIISKVYHSNIAGARVPHASVANLDNSKGNQFPFGSSSPGSSFNYTSTALSGLTVDAPQLTQLPSGNFDGAGNVASFTNVTTDNYQQIYSTTDSEGQIKRGVGNLPGTVTLTKAVADPEESSRSSRVFNPRAMVIFQDQSKDNPNDPPMINREFFALENPEKTKDGVLLFNHGLDAPTVTGSFLRSHVNPKDQTITYYFWDSSVNRWVISIQPYQLRDPNITNMSSMVFGRGNTRVFSWRPFARRVLF